MEFWVWLESAEEAEFDDPAEVENMEEVRSPMSSPPRPPRVEEKGVESGEKRWGSEGVLG